MFTVFQRRPRDPGTDTPVAESFELIDTAQSDDVIGAMVGQIHLHHQVGAAGKELSPGGCSLR